MLRKLLYFGSNKKSIPLLSPTEYRPTRIYAHQERPFSRYKPWAYIRDFTVGQPKKKNCFCFDVKIIARVIIRTTYLQIMKRKETNLENY